MSPDDWPFILVLAAVAFLILEVFIPSGGILATLSALAFVASIVAAFFYGGLQQGTYFLAGVSILIPALIYLSIKLWPKTPIGRKILNLPAGGEQTLPERLSERQQWLGRRGIAVTPMLPSGAIRIEGRTIDAISDGVSIEKGTEIEVHAIRGNYLVVRPARGPLENGPKSSAAEAVSDPKSPSPQSPLDEVIPDPFDDSLS